MSSSRSVDKFILDRRSVLKGKMPIAERPSFILDIAEAAGLTSTPYRCTPFLEFYDIFQNDLFQHTLNYKLAKRILKMVGSVSIERAIQLAPKELKDIKLPRSNKPQFIEWVAARIVLRVINRED